MDGLCLLFLRLLIYPASLLVRRFLLKSRAIFSSLNFLSVKQVLFYLPIILFYSLSLPRFVVRLQTSCVLNSSNYRSTSIVLHMAADMSAPHSSLF